MIDRNLIIGTLTAQKKCHKKVKRMAKDGSKRVTFDLSFDCTFEVLLSFWKGAQSMGTKKAPKLAWINM